MLFEDINEVMIHIQVGKKPEIVKFDVNLFTDDNGLIYVDGSCTGAKKRRGMVFISRPDTAYHCGLRNYCSLVKQGKIEGYLLYDEIDNHWDKYEGFDLNTATDILKEIN